LLSSVDYILSPVGCWAPSHQALQEDLGLATKVVGSPWRNTSRANGTLPGSSADCVRRVLSLHPGPLPPRHARSPVTLRHRLLWADGPQPVLPAGKDQLPRIRARRVFSDYSLGLSLSQGPPSSAHRPPATLSSPGSRSCSRNG
jgi:hypothetical protein